MNQLRFIIILLIIVKNINGQCALTIHQTKGQTDPFPELIVANYPDTCIIKINDSTLKFICNPKEPDYLMIFIDFNSKPKWVTRIWVDSEIKQRELLIDYTKKSVTIKNIIEWDSITKLTSELDRQNKLKEELEVVIPYLEKHPESFLSLWYFTHSYALYIESPKTKQELFNKLSISLDKYPLYIQTKVSFSIRHYPKEGDLFQEFSLKQGDGTVFNSAILKNKWIFLHFWSNNCAPCIREIDTMTDYYKTIDTSKIAFISISIDNDVNEWKTSSVTNKIKWTSVWQPNTFFGELCLNYNLMAIPFMAVFDNNKKLLYIKEGANEIKYIRETLKDIK